LSVLCEISPVFKEVLENRSLVRAAIGVICDRQHWRHCKGFAQSFSVAFALAMQHSSLGWCCPISIDAAWIWAWWLSGLFHSVLELPRRIWDSVWHPSCQWERQHQYFLSLLSGYASMLCP
jgi:hypothetical protein